MAGDGAAVGAPACVAGGAEVSQATTGTEETCPHAILQDTVEAAEGQQHWAVERIAARPGSAHEAVPGGLTPMRISPSAIRRLARGRLIYFTNRLMVCMSSVIFCSPSRRRMDSLTQVLMCPFMIFSET